MVHDLLARICEVLATGYVWKAVVATSQKPDWINAPIGAANYLRSPYAPVTNRGKAIWHPNSPADQRGHLLYAGALRRPVRDYRGLRAVIFHRDKHRTFPDCDRRPDWCDAHHVTRRDAAAKQP